MQFLVSQQINNVLSISLKTAVYLFLVTLKILRKSIPFRFIIGNRNFQLFPYIYFARVFAPNPPPAKQNTKRVLKGLLGTATVKSSKTIVSLKFSNTKSSKSSRIQNTNSHPSLPLPGSLFEDKRTCLKRKMAK